MMTLDEAMAELPLVAILRGITPGEARDACAALVEAGFRIIEVPLNSPDPFRSIATMTGEFASQAVIGAGTVMSEADLERVVAAGGKLVVTPHSDPTVIRAAKRSGCWCMPGVATPTEGFAALAAGADGLKLFPGESLQPRVVKAWRAVFPRSVALLPVGGVTPDSMQAYVDAGASGFGIGSALYSPGLAIDELGRRAADFVTAWRRVAPA